MYRNFEESMYIISPKENWYQLCAEDFDICLSAGDSLERVLAKATELVERHKRVQKFYTVCRNLTVEGSVPPSVKEGREGLKKVQSGMFYADLSAAIGKAGKAEPIHKNTRKLLKKRKPRVIKLTN